jgi:hypothetical protein
VHPVRGLQAGASATLLVVSALVLAGCGGSVDTAKVTYQRTTVPAGQDGGESETATGEPRTNDPDFTPEKLRVLDPCGLLTDDVLSNVGEPANNDRGDYAECGNYMSDSAGDELNISMTIGDNISNAEDADQNIGGLPALESELDGGDACFVSVLTSTDPNIGITIQANGAADDLCGAGRKVLTGVVDLIRANPPTYETPQGTLLEVDPCEAVKDETLRTALGADVGTGTPYKLHWCNWNAGAVSLGVWLRLGYDPATNSSGGEPVSLGSGVTAYKSTTTSSASSCELQWKHRQFAGEDTEIVHIFLDGQKPVKGQDPCKRAVTLAKTLITTLPKS